MLTPEQRLNFCKATALWNSNDFGNDLAQLCEPDDVAATRDTVADFMSGPAGHARRREECETPAGKLLVFRDCQTRKGARRGDLFLMDFGEARAAYFDGEV
jgi:hypothetical protein